MLFLCITLVIVLFLWILGMVLAFNYGRVGRLLLHQKPFPKAEQRSLVELPPLSIIIPAHNQAVDLRLHLPSILTQEYDRFEVIVIDMASTDETKDILERMELKHAHLHHTFIPPSARDISIERLSLTLGIRAAAYEWVVFTRPNCQPVSPNWLTLIGETIAMPDATLQSPRFQTPDMVLGITRYDENRNRWLGIRMDFLHLWNTLFNIHHILDGHAAIRAERGNMAFRKSYFFENGGFAVNHELKMGAEELLVNHTSKPSNTALMLTPSSQVLETPTDSPRQWKQQRIFDIETQRHQQHSTLYTFKQCTIMALPWLLVLCLFSPIPFSALDLVPSTYVYFFAAIVVVLFLIYIITKIKNFNTTASALSYKKLYLALLLLELQLPLWRLSSKIAHSRTDKNEFRKRFV